MTKANILYFKTDNKVMFLKTELLKHYPNLVTGHLKQFNFQAQFDSKDKLNHDYLIEHYCTSCPKKYFKKNILGVMYALRAGRIVRTIYKKRKDELFIIRDIIGTKDRIGHCFYLGIKDNIRKYIEGKLEIDILDTLKDNEQAFLDELEVFIGEVFRQFRYKDNLLRPEVYDATPINCLRLNNGKLHFFDFEFEITEGIAKECMLHKIICFICDYFKRKNDYEKYYSYFQTKFNLQNTRNWCEHFWYHYGSFDCPAYKYEQWEHYNNSFYVKSMKNLCRLLTSLIPNKKLRQDIRTKLIDYLCHPNYRIMASIGLDDFKGV